MSGSETPAVATAHDAQAVASDSEQDLEDDRDRSAEPWLEQRFDQRKDKADEAPILEMLDVPVLIHNGSGPSLCQSLLFSIFTGFKSLEELETAGGIERLFHAESGDDTRPCAGRADSNFRLIASSGAGASSLGEMERGGGTVAVLQSVGRSPMMPRQKQARCLPREDPADRQFAPRSWRIVVCP